MIKLIKKYFYFLPVLLFLPSLNIFFSGDDWFHLRISQVSTLREFFNFFSFAHSAQSASFYRPIPTQLFFYTFHKLFGLTVWPYHLFVLLCFGYSLYLVKKFCSSLNLKPYFCNLTTIIYGLSVSNFTRIYFLSSFQEISLVIFSLLCLLSFPKSKLKATLFFILALMSKETAIVLPLLVTLINFKMVRKNLFMLSPMVIVSAIYVYLRFFVFRETTGDSYIWNFSPAKAANTLMWYTLWSLGAPELLVDYVGSGLRLVPRFFTDYLFWWKIIVSLLGGAIFASVILFVKRISHSDDPGTGPSRQSLFKFLLFFLISLFPVLFLPFHKFTLELGLPLVGFSLALAWLIPKKLDIFALFFLSFYVCLNLSMNYLTYTRHYSVSRGVISQKIYSYFLNNYPDHPKGTYFEFINDTKNYGDNWGQSKQISQSLSGSDFFKVFYKDKDLMVYYQDIPESTPSGEQAIFISTKMFIEP